MIKYNNILRPVHDPPATPHAQNLGGRDPQPPRIDGVDAYDFNPIQLTDLQLKASVFIRESTNYLECHYNASHIVHNALFNRIK